MELKTLLDAAAKGYDADGFPPDGDTLAEFIQREITDTYDRRASDEEQVQEAMRVMGTAQNQLAGVWLALNNLIP